MDEVVWLKTILCIKLDRFWNKAASKRIKTTPCYVGPLVSRSVGRMVPFLLFWRFLVFEPTAHAQMLW